MTIEENKNNVYQAVKKACEKANRSSDEVNIIAVTKYVSVMSLKNWLKRESSTLLKIALINS